MVKRYHFHLMKTFVFCREWLSVMIYGLPVAVIRLLYNPAMSSQTLAIRGFEDIKIRRLNNLFNLSILQSYNLRILESSNRYGREGLKTSQLVCQNGFDVKNPAKTKIK